jgi:hypothetical protein
MSIRAREVQPAMIRADRRPQKKDICQALSGHLTPWRGCYLDAKCTLREVLSWLPMYVRYTIATLVVSSFAACAAMGAPTVRMGTTPPPPSGWTRPPRGEHLCPELGFLDPLVSPYEHFVAQRLLAGISQYRFAQMVIMSRVEQAIVVEVGQACVGSLGGQTQVVYATPRGSIYNALGAAMAHTSYSDANMQKALANLSVPIDVTKAPIDCATAGTLGNVWEAMLRGARFDDSGPRAGPNCSPLMDGESSHFSTSWGNDWMSAQTQSPDTQTYAGRLVRIGKALISYVKAPDPDRESTRIDMLAQANSLLTDLRQRDAGR